MQALRGEPRGLLPLEVQRAERARGTGPKLLGRIQRVYVASQGSYGRRAFSERCELQALGWGVNGWRGSCERRG